MSTSATPAVLAAPSLAERVRPVTLAGEQLLPVDDALTSVLALPGLVRGTTVAVTGPVAATSLGVALATRASAAGSWVASVGLPSLGLAAAEGLGLALERLVMVAPPESARWAAVLATLVEGFDVVLAGPPVRVRPADARRLVARLRERRSVLVQVGWPPGRWPEEPELSLRSGAVHWEGIGWGWGHCRARRVEAELSGRRGAVRPRRGWLWLPGPDGRLAPAAAPGAPEGLGPELFGAPGEGVPADGVPTVAATLERPRLNLVPGEPVRRRRRPAAAGAAADAGATGAAGRAAGAAERAEAGAAGAGRGAGEGRRRAGSAMNVGGPAMNAGGSAMNAGRGRDNAGRGAGRASAGRGRR